MSDTYSFGLVLAVTAVVGLVAVLSSRLTQRVRVPAPALFLIGTAIADEIVPSLRAPSEQVLQRVVTVALILILFDGGMRIGWPRFRSAAAPIAVVGVVGTFLTVGAVGLFVHFAFGLAWYASLLVATAIAPTDPAVVFSVLGQREISGRSGTILEGESGANDPVGISLMASLVAAGGLSLAAFGRIGGEFVLQMVVGASVGVIGGKALIWFMRRVALPSEGLYPLRSLAGVVALFGATTAAHGSGFLAVFAAGIIVGDEPAPYKRDIERFHSALASLGEIVAFVVLGLTVNLNVLARTDVWIPGLVVGVVLAAVARPILVGICLIPARLKRNQRDFVLFAGLKGAVPILLGSFIFEAHLADAERLYGIIVVVVVLSVVAQGGLVPAVAQRLRLPMRTIEVEPWALGVRLRHDPDGVHELTITTGSPADGVSIDDLEDFPADAWISLVVRGGHLVAVSGDTELQGGDRVLVLAPPDRRDELIDLFETIRQDPPPPDVTGTSSEGSSQ